MSRTLAVTLAALLISPCGPGLLRAEDVARLAIVIGNNEPSDGSRSALRYADDDAVATHRLLQEAGVDSMLFTSLDDETRAMNPGLAARRASWHELQRAEEQLIPKVKALRARGASVDLLLFYSGHGDVEAGEGYVLLEDARLTRGRLAALLERIGATRNHLLIDACKSYFLVFERGPGGERTLYTGAPPTLAIPARRSDTGFILSTSSDRESHEWERFRGGVFSHELRSGLRGAADIDRDGEISYAELGAFLESANRSILPRFRPDVMVRPPTANTSQPLLAWRKSYSIQLTPDAWGHIYLESARGDRLLDVHPSAERSARFWLPNERPLFVRRHDESLEVPVEQANVSEVNLAGARTPTIAPRGATSRAFEQLFGLPFSSNDVERFSAKLRKPELTRPTAPDDAVDPRSFRRRAIWLGSAVTALFLGSGLTTNALARREYERVERWLEHCVECSARRIRAQQRDGRILSKLANASWGLAAAAGLTTAVLVLLVPKWRAPRTEVSLGIGTLHVRGAL